MNYARSRSFNQIVALIFAFVAFFCLYRFIAIIGRYDSFIARREPYTNAFPYSESLPVTSDQTPTRSEIRRIRTNILFLKTHKTGSSTLQNILLRFGLRHSLDVMVPEKGNQLGWHRLLDNVTIGHHLTPATGKFNIFACHSKYQSNATSKFLYKDTIRVTLLRNPCRNFESVYDFYQLYALYNLSFENLVRSLPNTSVNFERTHLSDFGTNQMSHDLGLFVEKPDDTIIRSFVRYIDEEFDFVMITEYFDACLVLLADLMEWPLKYVAYLPLMIKEDGKKTNLTRANEENLRRLNLADSLLYDHFLKKFRQRILQYGVDRLIRDTKKLQKLNDDLHMKCISEEERSGYARTVSYTLRVDSDWECIYAAKQEIAFIEEIRRKQIKRFDSEKKLINFIFHWKEIDVL